MLDNRQRSENTWTPVDVVAHLLYTDRSNWKPRAHKISQIGETKPFDPFRRSAMSTSARNPASVTRRIRGRSVTSMLRRGILARRLTKRGARHGDRSACSPHGQAHDQTHLHQITRILAHQYREYGRPSGEILGRVAVQRSQRPRIHLRHEASTSSVPKAASSILLKGSTCPPNPIRSDHQ